MRNECREEDLEARTICDERSSFELVKDVWLLEEGLIFVFLVVLVLSGLYHCWILDVNSEINCISLLTLLKET